MSVLAQLMPLTIEFELRPLPEKYVVRVGVRERGERLLVAVPVYLGPPSPRDVGVRGLERTEKRVLGVLALLYEFAESVLVAVAMERQPKQRKARFKQPAIRYATVRRCFGACQLVGSEQAAHGKRFQ